MANIFSPMEILGGMYSPLEQEPVEVSPKAQTYITETFPVPTTEIAELSPYAKEILDVETPVVEAAIAPWLIPAIVGGVGWLIGQFTDSGVSEVSPYAKEILQEAGYMSNGVDLYGRSGVVMNGGGVPVGGPLVPEPPAQMVAKRWKTKAFSKTVGEYWVHFFRLVDGRMMCYNAAKHQWKMWRPRKPLAVMYRGKTSLSQAVKVQKYLDKMWRTVAKKTKALKLA